MSIAMLNSQEQLNSSETVASSSEDPTESVTANYYFQWIWIILADSGVVGSGIDEDVTLHPNESNMNETDATNSSKVVRICFIFFSDPEEKPVDNSTKDASANWTCPIDPVVLPETSYHSGTKRPRRIHAGTRVFDLSPRE
ncbi:hypothetical protein RUM43_010750 [Polyplax serrata]|uniref:Uncharacterized protein n=1 Tax=Polyplax serrata TaxID=468196 RepID=A0AAN8S7E3_POLSC